MMMNWKRYLAVGVVCLGTALSGTLHAQEILGAGATFPYPLYSKMFDAYHKATGKKVNYQAIGSGGGVRQIREKTVHFGASDAFVKDSALAKFSSPLLHVPTCLGAVTVTYNLPGNLTLRFSQEVLVDIFMGKIKKWNDPRLAQINPGVKLPKMNIVVVHRSDGSGTTAIFTDFLSKVSEAWKSKVGSGKSVNWPTGLGGKGNSGVAGLVRQVPGSIGYVELAYTLQNNMPQGLIENKAGSYIKPSLKYTSMAANTAEPLPDDTRISLTDTSAPNGYPIAGFTWLLVYQEQNYDGRTLKQAEELVDLLWWVTHDGQVYTEPLHYVPLSDMAKDKVETILKSITYNGQRVWKG